MAHLTHANRHLFRRTPDECFDTLQSITEFCRQQKENSRERWLLPQELTPLVELERLSVEAGSDGACLMNEWSFSQLCTLARINKETVNRLLPETARQVFQETLPAGRKPLHLLIHDQRVRSIHGVSYTRLWNVDLLNLVQEFVVDFQPPQKASIGGTGLYAGEQDMFCFLVDPAGWAEIDGQAFAPGFFVWNSEVGKRSVGISTFWFQAVCANHIVWDAVEVTEFTRKHTANVEDALAQVRRIIEELVQKREQRRDGFVRVIQNAMCAKLGTDKEEVRALLVSHGIGKKLAQRAIESAHQQGALTIFSIVDALTRLAQENCNAGERLQADQNAASLLQLAADPA